MIVIDPRLTRTAAHATEYVRIRSGTDIAVIYGMLWHIFKNGWEDKQFIYGTIVHIDIKGDKVWIQRNNTEINLAERLVERGIPKQNIVLGLHSPFMRKVSGYAVS